MEIRILGPLELTDGSRLLEPGGFRQRALLARLAVAANRVVTVESLLDELWGPEPPVGARQALQAQASRLRKVLGDSQRLVARSHGYVLHLSADELDAARFETLLSRGRAAAAAGDRHTAARRFAEAEGIWRGPALGEFSDFAFAQAEAARLSELRLGAIEARITAELDLGRHHDVVAELEALVGHEPYRERLWAQLILALYRAGRQADSLRAFAQLRGNLREELGIEPSPSLRRLERAVLVQAPELELLAHTDSPREVDPAAQDAPPRLPLPARARRREAFPFVGRDAEFAVVEAEWRQSLVDGPRLVLISGEPGVGKTRLVVELARFLYDQGVTVLFGQCEEELAAPYQPLVEVLVEIVRQSSDGALRERVGDRGAELARLVPAIGARLSDLAPSVQSDPETERVRLFDAVVDCFVAVASEAPVVVVVDDLHWAAKPTLALLRHLVSRSQLAPILVVATYRDTDVGSTHPLTETLGTLRRRATVASFRLDGLDEEAVAAFLDGVLGRPLGDEAGLLSRSLWQDTGGNPFFLGEVLRDLDRTSASDQDHRVVPESVRDVVRARLWHMSEVTQRMLAGAAVAGTEFDTEVVRLAGGFDEDEIVGGLDEAIRAGLLADVPDEGRRYRFAHALVRHTLYDDLTAPRRARGHQRTAEAIEALYRECLAEYLPALAHHFARAVSVAGSEKAVRYLTYAGDAALAQLANDDAARHYAAALALVPGNDQREFSLRCDLLLALGEAQRRAGAPEYRQTLLDAAAHAGRLGDGQRMARAALANSRGFFSSTREVDADRVAAIERALGAVDDEDSAVRARLLATLAVELVYAGDAAKNRQLSDEALAMARRVGDLGALAAVLAPRYMTIRPDPGTLAERLENTAELVAVTTQLGDPALICFAWFWRALAAMEAADIGQADRAFDEWEHVTRQLRQPTMTWYWTYCCASRALFEGCFERAEALSAEAYQLGQAAGHADAQVFTMLQTIQLEYERGSLDSVERQLRGILAARSTWPSVQSWLALVEAEGREPDDVNTAGFGADEVMAMSHEPAWLHITATSAARCARLEDVARAGGLYKLLRPFEDQIVTLVSLTYCGSVAHYLGLLARTLGLAEDAEAHFRHAARVHERMRAPAWLARTRLEWGRLLLGMEASGRKRQGTELLLQAHGCASELGIATVSREAQRLLASA